ncbi:nuclear transport factor 2 family protein [Defluviimonas salinarum]|uniref:Nuclear transport factor 2 family protein n=1 Tax=Defluviimonas salinarum TaxID=2992147 RepID=A0ABT3J0E8_9RHOB|nr:nuclear transport factor 2 family protein [Defluviimonas salinarum]MCW3781159.1 nuclear transport factor 2 family protein [Defluviimonas salinarum]
MDHFEDIRRTVATYVEGMARGDRAALARAFHPKAASIGHFGGGLEWDGVEKFIASCEAEAIPADAPVPPHEIESIVVAGDTAVVRVVNVWAGLDFRDTLNLLYHEGRWQIVAKVFLHLT